MLDYTYNYTFELFKETGICQELGQQTTQSRITNIPVRSKRHLCIVLRGVLNTIVDIVDKEFLATVDRQDKSKL
jgi:hypothetical protein